MVKKKALLIIFDETNVSYVHRKLLLRSTGPRGRSWVIISTLSCAILAGTTQQGKQETFKL